MPYSSILDWVIYKDPLQNAFYPYDVYNLPYDAGYKASELLLGLLAWLVNLLVPGNGLSTWLISDGIVNGVAVVLECIVIFAVGFIVNLTMIWEERKVLGRMMDRRATRSVRLDISSACATVLRPS